MTNSVKKFIEDNIELIEDEYYYDYLYDQAYDWLTDNQTEELTKILTETLGVDFVTYAKKNIIKHFNIELNNFIIGRHRDLILASFVRIYMNHINGLHWDEFQLLVEQELKDSSFVKVYKDSAKNLHMLTR